MVAKLLAPCDNDVTEGLKNCVKVVANRLKHCDEAAKKTRKNKVNGWKHITKQLLKRL